MRISDWSSDVCSSDLDTGIVANHHFLLPKNDNNFKFQSGTYCLDVHASIFGDKRTKMLFSEVFEISSAESSTIESGLGGLYLDWGQQSNRYLSYLDPPTARHSISQASERTDNIRERKRSDSK